MALGMKSAVQSEISLWNFAQEIYALPKVEQACLTLQEQYHCNIPLLLFCCWSGLNYGALADVRLEQAQALSDALTNTATRPLRQLRREMKSAYDPSWGVAQSEWFTLREQVKRVELRSEKLLLNNLERLLEDLAITTGRLEDVVTNIRSCYALGLQASRSLTIILQALYPGADLQITQALLD